MNKNIRHGHRPNRRTEERMDGRTNCVLRFVVTGSVSVAVLSFPFAVVAVVACIYIHLFRVVSVVVFVLVVGVVSVAGIAYTTTTNDYRRGHFRCVVIIPVAIVCVKSCSHSASNPAK